MNSGPKRALLHTAVKSIALEPRACECCGARDLESLWPHEFTARTRTRRFAFEINNVICRHCGFVFVSPVFNETDLAAYYADAHTAFEMQALDYDPATRLVLLEQTTEPGGVFVEVGAHQRTAFHAELGKRYHAVVTVDLNESSAVDRRALADIADASADVVAHYFVLEHVPRVIPFLQQCSRILKSGGVMITEVPDIAYYPRNPAALQLYEHTNHFSVAALQTLARRAGFEPLGGPAIASRVFGFALAFRKLPQPNGNPSVPNEYAINKGYVIEGLRQLAAQTDRWTRAAAQMEQERRHGRSPVLWAANDVLTAFLDAHPQPADIVVIDSDPGKRLFLDGRKVMLPENAASSVRTAEAIFIFTRNHARDILAAIERKFGKRFEDGQVHVVDMLGTMRPTEADNPAGSERVG
jgi:hypothetical protein